ncbi:MAG: hypothetical protein AMXMBFR13_42580 [Phycisphaerae bacterium]
MRRIRLIGRVVNGAYALAPGDPPVHRLSLPSRLSRGLAVNGGRKAKQYGRGNPNAGQNSANRTGQVHAFLSAEAGLRPGRGLRHRYSILATAQAHIRSSDG